MQRGQIGVSQRWQRSSVSVSGCRSQTVGGMGRAYVEGPPAPSGVGSGTAQPRRRASSRKRATTSSGRGDVAGLALALAR